MQFSRRHFIASAGSIAAISGEAFAQTPAPTAPAQPAPPATAAPAPAPAPQPPQPAPTPFSFETVKAKAQASSTKPYTYGPIQLPDDLKNLDYNHYKLIQYRRDKALWRGDSMFEVEFFHLGFIYPFRVGVNIVENGQSKPVAYSAENFDFGANKFKPDFPADLGFAGFRLWYPLNLGTKYDEFVAFLGASYFRMLGRNQQYGLSARGLAINTAEPEGEEFPYFTEFWIERPAPTQTNITLYALLESKSTTGAYRFVMTPGDNSTADIDAVLYPRADIKKPGIGALTSMFLHGKPDNRPFADIHPEDHDSDGLMMHSGAGEWMYRQLLDPVQLRVSSFSDKTPHGYGFVQRERNFDAYQDTDDNYERRPSYWIEPKTDWGEGIVQLIEIPSDSDTNDNMVSFWVPKEPVKAGKQVNFSYRLNAFLDRPDLPPLGYCVGTRTGPVEVNDIAKAHTGSPRRFYVDFGGPTITMIDRTMKVQAMITAANGTVSDVQTQKLPNNLWRASFLFTSTGKQDAELRGFLSLFGKPLTETWLYRFSISG
ncbi:MAG TPA: glucan biosynthesis protein [Stellaceae bacterium]|nr:glucan biosynthesis protein [Stellaceae bacterium]